MRNLIALQNKYPLGYRTGKLVVIAHEKCGKPPYCWLVSCLCDCGKTITERPHRLEHRSIKSCGCTLLEDLNKRFVDKYPIGMIHGKLVVVGHEITKLKELSRTGANYERRLIVKCECGKTKSMRSTAMKCAAIVSCGCVGLQHRIEGIKRSWTLPPGVASMNAAYSRYRGQAVHRGKEWHLSIEQFHEITQKICYYCGRMPSKVCRARRGSSAYVYNGIDRIDNLIGYTYANCVPCCKVCNYAKQTMTVEEFKAWVRDVAAYFLGMS